MYRLLTDHLHDDTVNDGEEYTEMNYAECGPPNIVLEIYEDFPASSDDPVYSTVFHHGIVSTNPVNVASLVEHVARYHSNIKELQKEYSVSWCHIFISYLSLSLSLSL